VAVSILDWFDSLSFLIDFEETLYAASVLMWIYFLDLVASRVPS
jgi:hypothetical protein